MTASTIDVVMIAMGNIKNKLPPGEFCKIVNDWKVIKEIVDNEKYLADLNAVEFKPKKKKKGLI